MKTKVIATIGMHSEDAHTLSKLAEKGMNVARMNFSHCTHDEYITRKKIITEECAKQGKQVSIMADLQGPRIRVGKLPEEGLELTRGEMVEFTIHENATDKIFIDEPSLVEALQIGHSIFLSSGEMELVVKNVEEDGFAAEVVRGGMLFSRKGVNAPDASIKFNGLLEKDKKDLEFVLAQGVEYVAVSFVQSAEDIKRVREIVGDKVKIVAKIESAQAVKNIDEIIKASDSIMIARGDLGVEMPMEKVPFIQKNLIRHAHWYGKGAIVATQMLLSMVQSKKPTRAEVSDVANAVLDGADAVMLSDETASGKYPLEALEMMTKIVGQTEELFHEMDNLL